MAAGAGVFPARGDAVSLIRGSQGHAQQNAAAVFTAGLVIAAFVSIPIVNLATPLSAWRSWSTCIKRLPARRAGADCAGAPGRDAGSVRRSESSI